MPRLAVVARAVTYIVCSFACSLQNPDLSHYALQKIKRSNRDNGAVRHFATGRAGDQTATTERCDTPQPAEPAWSVPLNNKSFSMRCYNIVLTYIIFYATLYRMFQDHKNVAIRWFLMDKSVLIYCFFMLYYIGYKVLDKVHFNCKCWRMYENKTGCW